MLFNGFTNSAQHLVEALNTSQAIIEFTPEGQVLRANENFCRAMGYVQEEFLGQHHRVFCPPEYVSSNEYGNFWRDLASGVFKSGEFKRVGKGGRIVWLQASYNPVRDRSGKIVRVVKMAADITAFKALSLDHAGKADAIERAQAIIEFTPQGNVLTANKNFLHTLGYRPEEIEGRHHSLFCDPKYASSAEYRTFWERLQKGHFQSGEFKRFGKGGREVFIQATYNPIFDDTGAVIKVVKFATDTTEAVQKRLRNEELSQIINAQLQDVMKQMDAASDMAATASTASVETGSVVSTVAAASEELSASIKDISDNMGKAKSGVEVIFSHAESAGVSAKVLNTSASSMNDIVTMIQEIASQINLLALNATIESARAGEAGRGFAVVASEVKSLANQAARSTEIISKEISNMQTVATEVVGALGLISTNMTSVLENVSSIARAIEQQTAVTSEISGNMQAAVTAVHQIDENLSFLTVAFGDVTTASSQVKDAVELLAG